LLVSFSIHLSSARPNLRYLPGATARFHRCDMTVPSWFSYRTFYQCIHANFAVTKLGKVVIHKAKRNNNLSFSKGKTWQLEDVRAVEVMGVCPLLLSWQVLTSSQRNSL